MNAPTRTVAARTSGEGRRTSNAGGADAGDVRDTGTGSARDTGVGDVRETDAGKTHTRRVKGAGRASRGREAADGATAAAAAASEPQEASGEAAVGGEPTKTAATEPREVVGAVVGGRKPGRGAAASAGGEPRKVAAAAAAVGRSRKTAAEAAPANGRQASKAARRQELIEATIDSLAKRGYEATTLADVAKGAGMSRGIVNFHFETKEKLLVETLRTLSDEYRSHWRGALAAAGDDPAARLWALVSADFDRRICTPRKLAAWCAFWGEAKSRPTYRALCSANDEEYQSTVVELVGQLAAPGQDVACLARGLVCMLEGLWLNLMMAPKDLKREQALACARVHLAAVFPHRFDADGPRRAPGDGGAAR